MEVGISSLYLMEKPFEYLVRSMRGRDVRLWEIVDDHRLRLNEKRIETLRKLKSDLGIKFTVHAPFSGINIASLLPESRQKAMKRLEESIRQASRLEADAWVVHPGLRSTVIARQSEEEWQLNVEAIVSLAAAAAKESVHMCLENMPRGFSGLMSDCESFLQLLDEMGSGGFGIALDIGHANTAGNLSAFLGSVSRHIAHIHAHDNKGQSDTHSEIGSGTVDWPVVIRKIRQTSCRALIVESTSGVEASLAKLQQLLRCPTAPPPGNPSQ